MDSERVQEEIAGSANEVSQIDCGMQANGIMKKLDITWCS
jgi:hypothetical protein